MVATRISAPRCARPRTSSTEYCHTPPTASAVMKIFSGGSLFSGALPVMPGYFQFHKWLRPLLLNIAK